MPKPRAARLETPTARRRLEVRKKPYWITISPGIALGYRRNAGSGTWSVRSTDGHGSDWIKRIALADDLERTDGCTSSRIGRRSTRRGRWRVGRKALPMMRADR
jgi:hypothetical protein